MCVITSYTEVLTIIKFAFPTVFSRYCFAFVCYSQMNTSGFQVHFLSFSRNISVQLVWEGLDVAGDIVAIQWIPRVNWEQLVDTNMKLYKHLEFDGPMYTHVFKCL